MKLTFNNIDWKKSKRRIAKLQEKIVVAWNKKKMKEVKQLQKILINSIDARALAVKKVISNDGGNTPGIDKIRWNTELTRTKAMEKLKNQKDYKSLPLKRVYIPKANGKLRPLSIPTLYDRAMQALHLMALDPIAESTSDKHSFGFRKFRGCHDAIETCTIILAERHRARYILNGDIKGFFDNISHRWILDNVYMDKKILKSWLKAGHIKGKNFFFDETGVPQGGIISPTIANIVLNGLEKKIKESVKHLYKRTKGKRYTPKVNVIRYADDFIVTADKYEILKNVVKPAISDFLKKRGTELNQEKSTIVSIEEGFDFLGFNIRKKKDYSRSSGEIYLSKPNKKSISKIKDKIRAVFITHKKANAITLISNLNPILRGWGNYFKIGISKRIFTKVSMYVFTKLLHWIKKKHPRMGIREARRIYFKRTHTRDWIFTGETAEGKSVQLFDITSIPIKRHTKVKDLNPYLSENYEYYEKRAKKETLNDANFNPFILRVLKKTEGICKVCDEIVEAGQEFEVHHITPKKQGGKDTIKNLIVLHKSCHNQVTYNKNLKLQAIFQKEEIDTLDRKS